MIIDALVNGLHWRAPYWLLLALQPLLVLTWRRWLAQRAEQRFAAPALLPWVRVDTGSTRAGWRSYLHTAAWVLAAIAAAGPRTALLEPGQTLRAGVDWLLAVDVSRSMTATDIAPSRLKRARIEILQLLSRLDGDRVGLLVYAGDAHLIAPPTYDLDALAQYLQLLQPDWLPSRGSRPARALDLAGTVLDPYADTSRAVLLITDSAGDPALSRAAAQRLRQQGIALYVLGLGSPGGMLLDAAQAEPGAAARPVPLDVQALTRLARAGGGDYATVSDDDRDLDQLYDDGIGRLAARRAGAPDETQVQWRELYPWFLVPALLLLGASLWPFAWRRGGAVYGAAALVLSALHGSPSQGAETASLQEAYRAYHEQHYRIAMDLYARLSGYAARMGEGASAYRLGEFPHAQREFTTAVLDAPDAAGRAAALLNLGNSYFQLGDYRNAAVVFADALRYRADFDAAQRNLAMAKMLAEAVDRQLAGHGPGQGRPGNDSQQGGGAGPYTLDEPADRAEPPPGEDRHGADQGDQRLDELVAQGLRHARAAAQGTAAGTVDGEAGDPSAGALAHMAQLEQDPTGLWRRIFELEEGILAPLPAPRSLPGVPPW